MKILSLFDGISCAQVALERAGKKPRYYYASEIDKYAIKITQKNFPNTIQLGDVTNIKGKYSAGITLLVAGSPCQGFSISGKQLGFDDTRSKLYFEFERLLYQVKPKYFLLENTAMKKEWRGVITKRLGVEPIMINSALVSAQSRKRLYWTNIPNVTQPEDKKIYLKDILELGYTERDKSLCVTSTYARACHRDYFFKSNRQLIFNKPVRVATIDKGGRAERIYGVDGKSVAISASNGGLGSKTGLYFDKGLVRKLFPIECERLQTLEDNFTAGVSNTQRYKLLGNCFTVDVIAHILRNI
jgi:DNA-cytosine methyltransferase